MAIRIYCLPLLLALCGLTPLVCHAQAPPAAQKHNPQAQAHRDQGDKLFTAQDYPGALQEYQTAYAIDKSNPAYAGDTGIDLRKTGNIHYARVQYSQAIDCYQKALGIAQHFNDNGAQADAFNNLGNVCLALKKEESSLHYYHQASMLYQQSKDLRGQARALDNLGEAYSRFKQFGKAINCYQRTASLFQQIMDTQRQWKSLNKEAEAFNNLGNVCFSLMQYNKCLVDFQQALPLFQQTKDTDGQAMALNNIGLVYDTLSQYNMAIEYYQQASPLYLQAKDPKREAANLLIIGIDYRFLSQYDKSIEYNQQALLLFQQIKDRDGQADATYQLGNAYEDLGQYNKAIDLFLQASPLYQQATDHEGQAGNLMSIGIVYRRLTQYDKAIGYYQQALTIFRHSKSAVGQADALNDMGLTYNYLGQYAQAIGDYKQALALYQHSKNPEAVKAPEANVLTNLGETYENRSQYNLAMEYDRQALTIFRQIKDTVGQANVLGNIGSTYFGQSQYDKAIGYYQQALALYQQGKDREDEAVALYSLMHIWSQQDNPRLAIFYGKRAVNVYQSIRQDIQGMDKMTQEIYLKHKEPTYRSLAKLLIDQGRLPEAIQILNMLKQEEYLNFTQNTQEGRQELAEQAQFTEPETTWNNQYQDATDTLTALAGQSLSLRDKINLTPDETAQLSSLDTQITQAAQNLQTILTTIQQEASQVSDKQDQLSAQADATQLQQTLTQLGHHSVAIYTLVGDVVPEADHKAQVQELTLLLVTPDKIKAYYSFAESDASDGKPKDANTTPLNQKIQAFQKALKLPDVDPRPFGKELNDLLVKPMEADLQASNAQTLMWSLDGSLRYIPVAALYDGKQYLVERYTNTLFSPASDTQLTAEPQAHWTGLGMGVSQGHPGFLALTNVPAELDSVIHDPQVAASKEGALPGTILLDPKFTRAALVSGLALHDPLVHIASHFAFAPGDAKDSFLLLGDGSHLSLADIQAMPDDLLAGVNLLTLSACQTAADGAGANGKEVENLAVLAQRKGAQAVMATLWSVNDAATEQLMHAFYDDRQEGAGMTKGDALRQAQLSVLNDGSLAQSTVGRGPNRAQVVPDKNHRDVAAVPYHLDPTHPQVHPYYWAPFILIGNWK